MNRKQRITNIFIGSCLLLYAVLLLSDPAENYTAVLAMMSLVILIYGVRLLLYYLTMARLMVGGRRILYKGVILFDLGLYLQSLAILPMIYGMLYLLGGLAFSGFVEVLRALEARKLSAPSWRWKLGQGIVSILAAFAGLFFLDLPEVLVGLYSFALITSAASRFAAAFRRSAIVYIP